MEELNISRVNLIGFSLGRAVAIDFTVKYPQNVESLVLMSGFYKVEGDLRNTMHQFRNNLEEGFEEFYDAILPMILCPDVIDDNVYELLDYVSFDKLDLIFLKNNDEMHPYRIEALILHNIYTSC